MFFIVLSITFFKQILLGAKLNIQNKNKNGEKVIKLVNSNNFMKLLNINNIILYRLINEKRIIYSFSKFIFVFSNAWIDNYYIAYLVIF